MADIASHLPAFLAAWAIMAIGVASPGPSVAMLLGIGTAQGRGAALMAAFGIGFGSVTLCLVTLIGLGLLMQETAWAMQALRLVGAAYLAWLSWQAFRKAVSPPPVTVTAVGRRGMARLFVTGFLMQATNPKAMAFWLAIASVGPTTGGGLAVVAAFVAGVFALSFAGHSAWALLLSTSPVRAAYARLRRGIEAGLGTLFAGFALRLAMDRS